jgi:hypothetical protein
MGPNLYSQTPGAFHAGGGSANPFAYNSMSMGGVYGPGAAGNAMGGFAASLPGHALTAGTVASMLPMGGAVGAVGNTLGFGALGMSAALPLSLAATYGAGQIAAGHQQNMMGQRTVQRVFGERNMGGRMGMGASREAISGYTSAFRQLANSAEMLTNDQELNTLVNKFSDMKLLETSRSVGEMASRVKKLAKTVREISFDLGTTLEGALPEVQRHAQMGFMDPEQMRQSIRTNKALRGAGIVMSDSTISGLEMSQAASNFAAGGSRRLGALGAQRLIGEASVATSMGILTDDDLMAATGKRGEGAVADFAQQSMQASRNVMNSGYGRNLAGFLGETDEGGRYTGKIDKEMRRKMRSMDIGEINRIAQEKLSKGAVSFERQMQRGMGADMAADMGGGDFGVMLDKIFKSEGNNEDEIMIILQRLTGMRGRSLDVLRKFHKEGERISAETKQRVQNSIVSRRLMSAVERNLSLSGRLDRMYRETIKEPIATPLQAMGDAISTGVGNYADNFSKQMMHHGLVSGGARALFGFGVGSNLGSQAVSDRLTTLGDDERGYGSIANSVDEGYLGGHNFGKTNSNMFVPSAGVKWEISQGGYGDNRLGREGGMDIIASGAERDRRLRDASKEVDEAATPQGSRGWRNTLFGRKDFAFMDVVDARNAVKDDPTMSPMERSIAEHALSMTGSSGSLKELVANIKKAQSARSVGDEERIRQQERGGAYGLVSRYVKATTGDKDNAHRDVAKALSDRVERQLDIGTGKMTRDVLQADMDDTASDLRGYITTDSGSWLGGFQEGVFGMSDTFSEVEDNYMSSLLDERKYNKLSKINAMLMNPDAVASLQELIVGRGGKNLNKVLEEFTGQKFSKSELEQIQPLIDRVIRSDKLGADFATAHSGGVGGKIQGALSRRRRSEMGLQTEAMRSQLNRSKDLTEDQKGAMRGGLAALGRGDLAEAGAAFSAKALEDMDVSNVSGGMGSVLRGLKSGPSDREGIVDLLSRKTDIKKDRLAEMSLQELRGLQTRLTMAETGTPETTQQGAALSALSSGDRDKVMAELASVMTATQTHTANFAKVITDRVKELEHK